MSDVRVVYRNPTIPCPDPTEMRTAVISRPSAVREVQTSRGTPGNPGAQGAPGNSIELRVENNFIEWRVVGSSTWIQLISVEELVGPEGPTTLEKINEQISTNPASTIEALNLSAAATTSIGTGTDGVDDSGLLVAYEALGGVGGARFVFDTSYNPSGTESVGTLYWDSTDGTLSLIQDGSVQQIGQELVVKVRNMSGETIPNGSPVYFSGRNGNRPLIRLARADVQATARVRGLTTQDIADGDEGAVTTFGYVRQIKTNYTGNGAWGTTWLAEDNLYVSKTVAGQLTNVEPAAPHHSDIVGQVSIVGNHGIGSIFVAPYHHKTLEDLSDVDGTPLTATGQLPVWDQVRGVFDFNYNITNYVPLAGGTIANLTISTSATFNAVSYVFGSGAAAAFRSALGLGSSSVKNYTQSDTSPSSPSNGDKWLDTSSGVEYTRYDTQWISTDAPAAVPDLKADSLDYSGSTPISVDLTDASVFPVSVDGSNGTRGTSPLTRLWTWIVAKIGTVTSINAGGAWSFTSTTRPTSNGTGNPEATSLINLNDGDARFPKSVTTGISGASRVTNIVQISTYDYANLAVKDANTLYIVTY